LDPGFLPAALWNRAYRDAVAASSGANLALALERSDGLVSVYRTAVLPHCAGNVGLNYRYVERLLKFLLWQKGGYRVTAGGDPEIASYGAGTPGALARSSANNDSPEASPWVSRAAHARAEFADLRAARYYGASH